MNTQRIILSTGAPMDAYVPHVSSQIDPDVRRPAIVICPGGGYSHLSKREAEPVALRFAALGFNCFVVWYRIAPHTYPAPQQDVAAAVAHVRAHAHQLACHPQKIAVMGFSAGGHAAGSLGVWWQRADLWQPLGLSPQDVRPNAMVLCYPVITGGEFAHRGSFEKLSGTQELSAHAALSLDTAVTADAPPCFLWHTWADAAVPVENTLLMAAALRRSGVTTEVHIFPFGGHGLALSSPLTASVAHTGQVVPECAAWPDLAARFLSQVM